jgi:hypothetical protein
MIEREMAWLVAQEYRGRARELVLHRNETQRPSDAIPREAGPCLDCVLSLMLLAEGDQRLFNQYSAILTNPARHPHIKAAWSRRYRVGDIVIFDVLGAAPRGSGATEAAPREDVRRVAESLRAPHEDFNGKAFLIVPG